jgi:plastocyanin
MKAVIKCSTPVLGLALAVMSCSRERQPVPKATPETPAASQKSATEQSAADKVGGAIFGKVIFKGKWQPRTVSVSKDQDVCGKSKPDPALVLSPQGEVHSAVVYIKNVQGTKKPEPVKVTLDQKGCEYRPHVLGFLAGSTVEILNPDGILHNVHAQSKVNSPFNLAQPKFKTSMEVKVEKPEIIPVKCDVHPWMSGWFFVAESLYFSVTDQEGSFFLPDIPAGKYVVELWHEKLGTRAKEVQVEANGNLEVNFEFAGQMS